MSEAVTVPSLTRMMTSTVFEESLVRDTHTHRQPARQTDRQTTDRQTDRQTDTYTH